MLKYAKPCKIKIPYFEFPVSETDFYHTWLSFELTKKKVIKKCETLQLPNSKHYNQLYFTTSTKNIEHLPDQLWIHAVDIIFTKYINKVTERLVLLPISRLSNTEYCQILIIGEFQIFKNKSQHSITFQRTPGIIRAPGTHARPLLHHRRTMFATVYRCFHHLSFSCHHATSAFRVAFAP